jgi:hypothetical protein
MVFLITTKLKTNERCKFRHSEEYRQDSREDKDHPMVGRDHAGNRGQECGVSTADGLRT